MIAVPCEVIAAQIGGLYDCTQIDGYTKIRTPYLYPDGDVIDLFFRQDTSGAIVLTDLGSTLQWLAIQTPVEKRTQRQKRIVEDVCLNHGAEFAEGALIVKITQESDLAWAVTRLTQAALRVADISFTLRAQVYGSVADEVADFLQERKIPFEQGVRLVGRSGETWTVDFRTEVPRKPSLVYVLSTGSRSMARRVAEHVLAAWVDLAGQRHFPEPTTFISLFEDTQDVWSDEDFKLVDQHSEVCRWSRPDDFIAKLAA